MSEKHLGKNELQPGPRILDRAVARVKLCDGNCYNFQGAIVIPTIRLAAGLHNSLCRFFHQPLESFAPAAARFAVLPLAALNQKV